MYEEEVIEEIKRFINSHMLEEITLKKISDAICYSEEHTSRLFKKQTGENLFDFIRNQRLLKAAEQIRTEGGKIINVALIMDLIPMKFLQELFQHILAFLPGGSGR